MQGYMRVALPFLLAFSALSHAQSVISAHSGVVQYVEGDVSIDNQPIHPKFAQFPEVKPDQVIATGEGALAAVQAEIYLDELECALPQSERAAGGSAAAPV